MSLPGNLFSLKFNITGKVETIRKDKIITLIFDERPTGINYIIIEDDMAAGKLQIINVSSFIKNKKIIYRALAQYSIEGENDLIKAGSSIGLIKEDEEKNPETPIEETKKEKKIYKETIVTDIDLREMILIPSGKFIFGSDSGEKDEKPQQTILLDDYYIDKYEVSNSDYALFIKKTNSKPPISWTTGNYRNGEDDFPVTISYYEAVRYAEWAGKSLPTEEEWEKAARGTGIEYVKDQDGHYVTITKPVVYPWGNQFDALKTNSIEFWDDNNITNDIKKKYPRGLLPVYFSRGTGDSVYGIVNMSGNAAEWTSSWYNAYKGSRLSDKMFGRQVKVIRGGTWFQSRDKLRTTNREIGGLPNLYDDNIAGFRCVKEPSIVDISKAN
jgi:formylglycine-generating enzyme required for sulfatase activity